jgi:hypothetical protein
MLSSGSLTLYKGSKDNGSLTNVTADSFGQVASDAFGRADVSKA